jgi:hypothetical protein
LADLKISALPASTTPLAGTEVLPIVQSSATKQVSIANLTAGRDVSALSFASTTGANFATTSGNVGIGTASPQTRLQVDGTATTSTVFNVRLNNTSGPTGSGVGIEAYTAGVNSIGNFQFIRTGSAFGQSAFTVSTADANGGGVLERIRVDSIGNVGIGTTSPSASAILDAQSTTKGVRMPNMTTTQKNAIASPAAGLMVFDTTLAKLCVYSGAAWQTVTSI